MKKFLSLLISAFLCFSMFLTFAMQVKMETYEDEWPMHRHDLQRTGYSDGISPSTNDTLWKYDVGEIMHLSGPAVAEGKVIVGLGRSGYVYCLNASDGRFIWRYKTGWHVWSGATIVDGRVYIGSSDGNVYCFDADNGTVLWMYSTGPVDSTQVFSSPAVSNGKLYIGAKNNYVYCLNASDGTVIWKFKTEYIVWSSPAIFEDKVYIGSRDSYLYCLNASDGSQLWRYQTGDAIYRDPAIWSGNVYIASYDNYIYCLDANTGSQVWKFETGDDIHNSPAVAYGNVYIGSYDNYLYCLNASDGSLVWKYKTGAQIRSSSPAVADDKVYIGSLDHFVYCFDAYDGSIIWKYKTGGEIWYSPAIAYGNVYIGSDDHYVYAFGPSIIYPSSNIDIDPDTLNLKNKGKWITAHIELSGYNVSDINVTSIWLNDTIPAETHPTGIGDEDGDGVPDLMVKFDRAAVASYIEANVNMTRLAEEKFMVVTLTVTGELSEGAPFGGNDRIRVIYPTSMGAGPENRRFIR